ncbi:tetratricopeptide repeat protein [Altererythrobacter indicus]|uniref:Tetratricopeptide repeat protein n=1 Tax=Altericroceibacterium indicum TaxID=374177 RepID=A0A845A8T9_9SPHN|nr:SPOR domain-containing protein [Altericroceibacterium indicum]MXP25663.1 tetratricopeptide repeat protein [Altericroceibacterium indicum]
MVRSTDGESMRHLALRKGHFFRQLGLGAALIICPTMLQAQGVSRPVVQPLPPAASSDLSNALKALARNSQDVDALIAAGDAAVRLDDYDAALGFLGRAQSISPNDPRIDASLAVMALRKDQPVEALTLFDKAEKAGLALDSYAADRALAYDLVGNNTRAQQLYQQALRADANNDELRRQLAMSQAISGNRAAAEATLLPMLQKQDLAAYRTRAFALAVLGDTEEAVSIAQTILPKTLSDRIAPYLRYMPRLTKAQQATAANLGKFPDADKIGREDPALRQFADVGQQTGSGAQAMANGRANVETAAVDTRRNSKGRTRAERNSDRLTPTGRPMGSRTTTAQSATTKLTPGRTPIKAEPEQVSAVPQPASGELPPVESASAKSAEVAVAQNRSAPAQTPIRRESTLPPSPQVVAELQKMRSDPVVQAVPQKTPVLAQQQPSPEPIRPVPEEQAKAETLSSAFSDFTLPPQNQRVVPSGAVDITKITPARPQPKPKEPPKPKPPAFPSRNWVQVATGKNVSAFKFDWKRISKKADGLLDGKKTYTAKWVEANRLLFGPFPSESDAQDMVTQLKKKGVDAFTFTSAEGEEIKPLS